MSYSCQFCDKNPGYLISFARSYTCLNCMDKYHLEDHPFLGSNSVFGGYDSYDRLGGYHYLDEDYYYDIPPIKPIKSKVVVEELQCNAHDLTSFSSRLVPFCKVKKTEKKWTVELFY